MPGTLKPYRVKIFLFDADQPEATASGDHWFSWHDEVVGLSNLPTQILSRVVPIIGNLTPGVALMWRKKKLPMLRNSLSYHRGHHGVTSFDATVESGKTYPIRVYVEPITNA